MQNEQVFQAAIASSVDWQQAIVDFITASTSIGQPFTTGHITTAMRVYRPEFNFKHEWVSEKVQDLFYNNEVVFNGVPGVQVPRVCAGIGRTPAGTTVFTYAAEQSEALTFPFELDIPKPGAGLKTMPTEHPIQASSPAPNPPAQADMKATVHNDLRLCIPRAALEALFHVTGQAMRGNDAVWVRFDVNPDRVYVSVAQQQGAVSYDISAGRGRVLFPKAGSGQFEHGDIYAIEIDGKELAIDLTKKL